MSDSFFHRVIASAADRGATQFVVVGTAVDDQAAPDARWWQFPDPGNEAGDLGQTLTAKGFEPDSPALFCVAGARAGLSRPALARVLTELRPLAAPGTRLALSLPAELAGGDGTGELLGASRWRAIEISERAQRAGLRMLAPVWAPPAPGGPASNGRLARFSERMLYRPAGDAVARHLEAAYGVSVTGIRELDLGVHRVDLNQGSRWIARVFPAARTAAAVGQDAELLTGLTAAGFPAERCAAPEPVTVLDGHGVLVTEHAPGRPLAAKALSFELIGRLLGQLHTLDAARQPAAARPGGAWHHLVPDASTTDEVAALRALLHDARFKVPAGQARHYDTLTAAAQAADPCADLPHALVHPDCVPGNTLGQPGGDVTIIDWAGAGSGPRIVSLGCLLWAAAGSKPSVAAAISGYRESVTLEPGEVGRLAAAMRLRPLVLACWTFATGRGKLEDVARYWEQHRRRIDAGAEHALELGW